jgi:DNA-binding transcriptional regulator YiaG
MDFSITELVRNYPQASVTVNAADLEQFGTALLKKARQEFETELIQKINAEKEHALLTAKEVAEYFSVSTRTVTRWRKAGYLTPVPVGGIFKYRRSDCRRVLQEKGRA